MDLIHEFLFDHPILSVLQLAFTIWMAVEAGRSGTFFWIWIIIIFQPIGPWIYFFVEMRERVFGRLSGRLPSMAHLFERKASLDQLEYQAQQSPTVANQLALADRLVELGRFQDAVGYLEGALKREPDFAPANFALARCKYELHDSAEAERLLTTIVSKEPRWSDYAAWRLLLDVQEDLKRHEALIDTARQLVKMAPRLEHKVILADRLARMNQEGEARLVLENALQEQRFVTGAIRRINRPHVRRAQRLLRELSPR
jgi:hypothetical protein